MRRELCLLLLCLGLVPLPCWGDFRVEVVPAATGKQLVRASVPLPRGFLRDDQDLEAISGGISCPVAVRVLGHYITKDAEQPSVRRAMLTWPCEFATSAPMTVELRPVDKKPEPVPPLPTRVQFLEDRLQMECHPVGSAPPSPLTARWITDVKPPTEPRVEIIESNPYFDWRRWYLDDERRPLIIEVRTDVLGVVALRLHAQSREEARYRAPDLGWEISFPAARATQLEALKSTPVGEQIISHSFGEGVPCAWRSDDQNLIVESPTAPWLRRGDVEVQQQQGQLHWRYHRCRATENVPMQWMSWRKADALVRPAGVAPLTATLEYPHEVRVAAAVWDEAYGIGAAVQPVGFPDLEACLHFHREAMIQLSVVGDDWGNVTSFAEGAPHGGVFGMNRLNHCRPLFEEGWRIRDRRLVQSGVLWCDNFHDQSIWWGPVGYGGTRYNNITAQNKQTAPDGDQTYMWRSNNAVDFCTKGYDSFLLAYEQTGDPRMQQALDAQTRYASEFVQIKNQTRNVGDVRDFVYLSRYTGQFLEQGLRLFGELREKLSPGDLFSQGGEPIESQLPFIDDDERGYQHPFAKPYIIGYALAGLPDLAASVPQEPRLKEVIQAAAEFLCDSQDPVGAWRYPHPKSSQMIGSQAIEHAWQISLADRFLGADSRRLDAIERTLRQRILGWRKTGKVFGGIQGWEYAAGKANQASDIHALYQTPDERDGRRDYSEGRIGFGGSSPEGLVYFPELLRYYLRHRSGLRLLRAPRADEPLGIVLDRVEGTVPPQPPADYQTPGIKDLLPVFRERALERMKFPLAWTRGNFTDFEAWRRTARDRVQSSLLAFTPPPKFEPLVIAEEDRGTYWARKVVLNVSADSRVLALQTIPKGSGPFPAVLLLHDHGAKFDIGKEKVIRPFDVTPEKQASAEDWVGKYYGGRFLGDELARRGYVCFATDMLNWSDRGGAGFENQQALASNLLHLGMTHAGLIAHEDLQAVEFLATQPQVDPGRIAAMGLSVGCYRTWQVAALSDRIAAGVAICWMGTTRELMVPGNNQTKGQSAFVMTHPGLSNFLDYPDVASIACPKSMLFYNGLKDGLFPVEGVRDAYRTMQGVWDSQGAGNRLVTKLWDVPHLFNAAMQDEAFQWLDTQFQITPPVPTH